MKSSYRAALLALFLVVVEAIPNNYQLHEARHDATRGRLGKRELSMRADTIIPIKIALTQTSLQDGYDHVLRISHPTSDHYGKHWTSEDVETFFAPSTEAASTVRSWLAEASGLDIEAVSVSNNGWLMANMPVSIVERVFATRYYEHEDSRGRVRMACDGYSLPANIRSHVDYIVPGVKSSPPLLLEHTTSDPYFPSGQKAARLPRDTGHRQSSQLQPLRRDVQQLPPDLQDCGENITPACLRALYHIPRAYRNDSLNALGIYEDGDIYAQSDLNSFYAAYAPHIPQNTAPSLVLVDGAQAPVAEDDPRNEGESDVDISLALSLIYPQKVVIYQVDDQPQADQILHGRLSGFLNNWLDSLDGSYCTYTYDGLSGNSAGIDPVYPDPLPRGYPGQLQCGVYTPTRVISISYDQAEADYPERYQKRQCNEFMKLALQGHTIVASTGNFGVASFPGDVTRSGCLGANQTVFNPSVLGACPYVLSVGATQLLTNQTVLDRESAVSDRYHGNGGFSNRYSAPRYQQQAVSKYFAHYDPGLPFYVAGSNDTNIGANGGLYNRAGKGYPDVSGNGAYFRAFTNGTDHPIFGTSLAAPLWAAVLTLINEERTAVGKGPVGFVHPALYGNPSAMNDITAGSNPGCHSTGFKASPGWDPVTGLGTPDYPRLLALFLSLP